MTLRDLVNTELPLNRKERFFTGTVFPMLVCRDNFRYFNLLTSLINGCSDLKISIKSPNIQFFTEYSLVESIITKSDRKRFPNPPQTKDTPDIIALITGTPKILLSVEAKMYDVPDAYALKNQMDAQRKHVDYLKERLNIGITYQCALLPQKLTDAVSYQRNGFHYIHKSDYQVITWEALHRKFQQVFPDDYFLNLLKLALDSYSDLVSHSWVSSSCELKLCGREIYQKSKLGTLDMKIMGRDKGLNGEPLKRDIESGKWKSQQYETSSQENLPSDNWFSINEFIKLIDGVD